MDEQELEQRKAEFVNANHKKLRLMETNVTFFLQEYPARFLNWSEQYIENLNTRTFRGNYGAECLVLEPMESPEPEGGDFILNVAGRFMDDYAVNPDWVVFAPVRFELKARTAEEMTVIIRVWNFFDLVDDFLTKYLKLVAARWSDSMNLLEVNTGGRHHMVDDNTWATWTDAAERLRSALRPGTPSAEKAPATSEAAVTRKKGPTRRTIDRAYRFKEIKDKNPDLSQWQVAMKASREYGEDFSANTVRNCYRAMGWEWERADRVR